jgi:hypothetical protein
VPLQRPQGSPPCALPLPLHRGHVSNSALPSLPLGSFSIPICSSFGLKLSGLRLDPEPCALRVGESIMLRVDAQRSRLLPPRQTKRLCKLQAVPAWGMSRRLRAARCVRSSRVCHRRISTLSSRPVFSLVASTCSGERAASTPQGDLGADAHRDQLAGERDHTCIWVTAQPAHSCASTIIHRLFRSSACVRPLGAPLRVRQEE